MQPRLVIGPASRPTLRKQAVDALRAVARAEGVTRTEARQLAHDALSLDDAAVRVLATRIRASTAVNYDALVPLCERVLQRLH